MGYISLFTGEDCIRPMLYVPRDRNTTFAAKKLFCINQLLDQHQQQPKAARKKDRAMVTSANASIRSTVPLGLFHRSLSSCPMLVDVAFFQVLLMTTHIPHSAVMHLGIGRLRVIYKHKYVSIIEVISQPLFKK